MSKLFEYASAVREYHYYRKYWQPKDLQSLNCAHEEYNPFDFLAIKVVHVTLELQNSSLTGVLELYQASLQPITVF